MQAVTIRKVANGYLVDTNNNFDSRSITPGVNLHVFATFQQMCDWLEKHMDKEK